MAESQHFYLAAKNHTKHRFVYKDKEKSMWGGVYDTVAIEPRTTTTSVFYARGNRDAAAGTSGWMRYEAEDDESIIIKFKWSVPWGNYETYLDVTVEGPIKLAKSHFGESEVLRKVVTIDIKDDKM